MTEHAAALRVLIAGGGTGGHTSPALAIVEALRQRVPGLEVVWVGRRGAIEERVSAANSIPFYAVPGEGWPRRNVWRRGIVAAKTVWALMQSARLLHGFHPDVAIGVGGYVSLAPLLAAQWLGYPTVIHEQNKRLGMANRILARKARRLFLSYEDTLGAYPKDRTLLTGNPVRAAFADPPAQAAARARFGLRPDVPAVLVTGGSQGAQSINRAVAAMAERMAPDALQLIWMSGGPNEAMAREAITRARIPVVVFPFIEDMAAACAAADCIVGRAGASSTAEIALMGKPSILVPYPHAADNHQEDNARAFEQAGAALVMNDAECTGNRLAEALLALLQDSARLAAMGDAAKAMAKPAAASCIAQEILELLRSRKEP